MIEQLNMAPILETSNLHKTFTGMGEDVHALCGIDLKVEGGEFIAIMGASGSGKSTLLHMCGGLDKPTKGNVIIENQDITAMSDQQRTLFRRRRLGIVFQSFNLLPNLSARENIELPLLIDGDHPASHSSHVVQILDAVHMKHRANHRPQALSGGEQQRVAIGRALVNDPAVLLADEPTGNLDSQHAAEIWKLLRNLADEQNRSIIAVTHEAAGAAWADRVLVMQDGQIVSQIDTAGKGDATSVASQYTNLIRTHD